MAWFTSPKRRESDRSPYVGDCVAATLVPSLQGSGCGSHDDPVWRRTLVLLPVVRALVDRATAQAWPANHLESRSQVDAVNSLGVARLCSPATRLERTPDLPALLLRAHQRCTRAALWLQTRGDTLTALPVVTVIRRRPDLVVSLATSGSRTSPQPATADRPHNSNAVQRTDGWWAMVRRAPGGRCVSARGRVSEVGRQRGHRTSARSTAPLAIAGRGRAPGY